jgi:hypothetical protein
LSPKREVNAERDREVIEEKPHAAARFQVFVHRQQTPASKPSTSRTLA